MRSASYEMVSLSTHSKFAGQDREGRAVASKSARAPVAPPVGVIITNYNNRRFLADAIESVAAQTVRNFRVVVVDDASTDESDQAIREVLSRLNDDRFSYVRHDANLGQVGAIRSGLAELDAPFVCFLDSDDYWYPEFIAQHLSAHLNTDFPVALSFCDSHIVDLNGHMLAGTAWWFDSHEIRPARRHIDPSMVPDVQSGAGRLIYPVNPRMMLHAEWSLDSATNSMASMMLRRSFVDLVLVPADQRLPLYVDFYLSTFAALLTGTIAIHDALYAYRMHGKNLHSNGRLFGGAYNSSTANWGEIRSDILRLTLETLRSEATPIRQAFGGPRYEFAEAQIKDALDPRARKTAFGDRLRRLLRWPRSAKPTLP